MDFLAEGGEELYVVPNYSYVSLGTAFFVPIHGSAVDYSTVADTITRVVLYDPESDRIISAGRHESDFAENVYNLRSSAVVLRLYLRAKPKSRYYVRRETLTGATAADLIDALRDLEATNVEIRQGHAASPRVTVSRYYTDLEGTIGAAPGVAPRRPRPPLGSPRGEPADLVPHALPEPACGLAYRALLHPGRVRDVLADARPGRPPQDPAPLHPTRRDAPLALPRRGPRLRRPLPLSSRQETIRRLHQSTLPAVRYNPANTAIRPRMHNLAAPAETIE